MGCLERGTGDPHYCPWKPHTLHRIWDSSDPEVQPSSVACVKRLAGAVCLNDRGSKYLYFTGEYARLFCQNCIFQGCAVWLMQAAAWGSAGSTTNILPPSVETADACRWDMVHGVGKSISGDGNEGARGAGDEDEDRLCCITILCPNLRHQRPRGRRSLTGACVKPGFRSFQDTFFNSNFALNDFKANRHFLVDSSKCLQLWFVWMSFFLGFLLPSAASEAKHLNNASVISSVYWLLEKGLCKWIQSTLLHSSVQCCSWRMCYLNKS